MPLQRQQNTSGFFLPFFNVKIDLNIFVGGRELCQDPQYVATPTRARLNSEKYAIEYSKLMPSFASNYLKRLTLINYARPNERSHSASKQNQFNVFRCMRR